jgi:hypothetical protein
MKTKLNSVIQRDAAIDWVDKWFELSILVIDVTSTDEPPYSAPLPTDSDEINYQRLRFWLKGHETQFVPLWQDSYACQDWAVKDNNEENDDLFRNPFSCLYAPENLYRLAKEFDLQSGIEVWEPSKDRANEANSIIIHMGKRMLEFVKWIDERVRD